MKFATEMLEIEARAFLEALAVKFEGKVAQSRAMIKVGIPAQALAKRRTLGTLTMTYHVNTSNIVITAPATEIEFLYKRLVELEQCYRELLQQKEEPGSKTTPVDKDLHKAMDCLRIPAWTTFRPETLSNNDTGKPGPPRNIPMDNDYLPKVRSVLTYGMEQLDEYPEWKQKFIQLMAELGAVPEDEDWYEMDMKDSAPPSPEKRNGPTPTRG